MVERTLNVEKTFKMVEELWEPCSKCGASRKFSEIRHWSTVFHDGQIWCTVCDSYQGTWDDQLGRVSNAPKLG